MTRFKESTERRKTRFVKETVENADLHKAVLNKKMTTQEYSVQYDFVAPLTITTNKAFLTVEYFLPNLFIGLFHYALLICLLSWKTRGSHRRCYVRKDVLRNFAKFTGKHLCQDLFFNKVEGFSVQLY